MSDSDLKKNDKKIQSKRDYDEEEEQEEDDDHNGSHHHSSKYRVV